MAWTVVQFGKYRGKTLPQIIFTDPDWFFWAVENDTFKSAALKAEASDIRRKATRIKIPALRYDLRQGSFQEAWDTFIPSLAEEVRGGQEYLESCAICERRSDCRWCAVYGFLEHRRLGAKVDYLCAVADEVRRFKMNWEVRHRRYYECAGITLRAESELPITDATFFPTFNLFEVAPTEGSTISIRHFSDLPVCQLK